MTIWWIGFSRSSRHSVTTKVKSYCLGIRGIPVEVVHKTIKNLHIGVYPPSGRVRVAAPQHLDDEAVRLAVVSRLGWIRRKQTEFEQQERQSQRELVTGESHYFRADATGSKCLNTMAARLFICSTIRQWSCALVQVMIETPGRQCSIDGTAASSATSCRRSSPNGSGKLV